jgi:hypothetical protein
MQGAVWRSVQGRVARGNSHGCFVCVRLGSCSAALMAASVPWPGQVWRLQLFTHSTCQVGTGSLESAAFRHPPLHARTWEVSSTVRGVLLSATLNLLPHIRSIPVVDSTALCE